MSFLSRKRTPLGAIRLNHPGVAGFECAFCNYRVTLRTSPNALGQWAKARGKIGAHVRERHPEKLTPTRAFEGERSAASLNADLGTIGTSKNPRPTLCLACAREGNAAAGFRGIDREQSGHVPHRWRCTTCGAVWDPVADPAGYIADGEHPAHCCKPMEPIEET